MHQGDLAKSWCHSDPSISGVTAIICRTKDSRRWACTVTWRFAGIFQPPKTMKKHMFPPLETCFKDKKRVQTSNIVETSTLNHPQRRCSLEKMTAVNTIIKGIKDTVRNMALEFEYYPDIMGGWWWRCKIFPMEKSCQGRRCIINYLLDSTRWPKTEMLNLMFNQFNHPSSLLTQDGRIRS